jgi:hypothetical protein
LQPADKFFLAIDAILMNMKTSIVHVAFLDSMQRSQQYIEADGNGFEGA